MNTEEMKWTKGLLLDLIEFSRHVSPSYGITNIYDQFIDIVTDPDKSLQQWYMQQAKNSLSNPSYNISDMEESFNLSRDRLFGTDGTYKGFRFASFSEYMSHRDNMIDAVTKNIV